MDHSQTEPVEPAVPDTPDTSLALPKEPGGQPPVAGELATLSLPDERAVLSPFPDGPAPARSSKLKERKERLRRAAGVASVLAMTALAACGVSKPAPAVHANAAKSHSATATVDSTINFHESVLDLFNGWQDADGSYVQYVPTEETANQARAILASRPSKLTVSPRALEAATNYYTAAVAVNEAPDSSPDHDLLGQSLAEARRITDPKLRAQTIHAIQGVYAEGASEPPRTKVRGFHLPACLNLIGS